MLISYDAMQLKRVIIKPPQPHPEAVHCNADGQQKLMRAWALAVAYISWDCHPDTSASAIESTLYGLGDQISCGVCLARLRERIREVVNDWSLVRVSDVSRSFP